MGWGTSAKRAASPQPVRAAKVVEDLEDEVAVVPPSKEHHAEMEWAKERARWASDTANMIVTDFVRSKALFGELVKFSRKRRR